MSLKKIFREKRRAVERTIKTSLAEHYTTIFLISDNEFTRTRVLMSFNQFGSTESNKNIVYIILYYIIETAKE